MECLRSKNRRAPQTTEANFHATISHSKQSLKNIHTMTLASFCSHLPRLDRKTQRMTGCRLCISANTVNVQSLTTSVDESQVVDITPVWHLSITKSRT